MSNNGEKRNRGFTLIEVLVALVIVSILLTVVLPTYRGYVQRATRTEGINGLSQIAAMQETWFTQNRTYTADLRELGLTNEIWNNTTDGNYRIRVMTPVSPTCEITNCYVLYTTPNTGSAQTDDPFDFELRSNGVRRTFNRISSTWQAGWDHIN